jgi:hypothetical protein
MDALNWRKASYSASNGGGCVEVGDAPGAVLVRDTTDRTGPVLKFSPDAWRRFADQVKRSLAPGPYRVRGRPAGALSVSGVPRGVWWCSSLAGAVRGRGVGAAGICFPSVPGSARYSSRLWCAQRALGPGEAGGGPGEPGTGLWGVPGSPGACSFHQPKGAARYSRIAARSVAPCALSTAMRGGFACAFPGHPCGGPPALLCTFLGHLYGGVPLQCGSGLVPPGVCLLAE